MFTPKHFVSGATVKSSSSNADSERCYMASNNELTGQEIKH